MYLKARNKTVSFLFIAFIFLLFFINDKPFIVKAANNGFNIENGILISYYGNERNVIVPKSVRIIGKEAFYQKDIETIIIPNTVKKIESRAFTLCTKLKSVTLPTSITSIPNSTFMSCISLKSITVPKSVKEIGNMAFWNCKNLSTIKILNKNIYIGSEVFTDTAWLTNNKNKFITINGNLIMYKGEDPIVVVPNNIRVICGESFSQLEGFEKITLPSSVEIIGENAFNLCEKLRKVKMSDSVTKICDSAFNQCYSLENITLSDNLKEIGSTAFWHSGLISIDIPKSVKKIGSDAFGDCRNLIEVNLPVTLTNISPDAFHWTPWVKNLISDSKDDFVILNGKLFAYKGSSKIIKIPDGVTAIMSGAFEKTNINKLTMPNSVTEIGYSAFYSCKQLTKVIFSKNLLRIDMYAFRYCSRLETLNLPNNLTYLGQFSFGNCSSLKKVSIPKNVDIDFYSNPFDYCMKLTSIYCNGNKKAHEYMSNLANEYNLKCTIKK